MSDDVHFQFESGGDELIITDESVRIEKGGFLNTLAFNVESGTKEIDVREVTGVETNRNAVHLNQNGFERETRVSKNTITVGVFDDADKIADEIRETIRERKDALNNGASDSDGDDDDPLTILKRRFAEGEIDEDEFERKRELLTDE